MGKRPSLAESMRQVAHEEPTPARVVTVTARMPQAETPPLEPIVANTSAFHAATRMGKKKVTANLDPAAHKRLKGLAVERETTTEALLDEAIRDLFAKYLGS